MTINVNKKVITALKALNLPIFASFAEFEQRGKNKENYIIFIYSDERDIQYTDDEVSQDLTTIQVHYFTKNNPQNIKLKIRKILRSLDFIEFSTTDFFEDDTKYNHIIVECSIINQIDERNDL